jgi:hypothetical protein
LADVVGVGAAEPVPAADGPDQRGIPLHERVPRLLVAVSGRITRSVTTGSSRIGVVPCRVSAYSLCCRMAYGLM